MHVRRRGDIEPLFREDSLMDPSFGPAYSRLVLAMLSHPEPEQTYSVHLGTSQIAPIDAAPEIHAFHKHGTVRAFARSLDEELDGILNSAGILFSYPYTFFSIFSLFLYISFHFHVLFRFCAGTFPFLPLAMPDICYFMVQICGL